MLYKQGQKTFIYCPKCNMELISSESRIEGTVPMPSEHYRCTNCYTLTEWDFDSPTPILVEDFGNSDKSYNRMRDIGYYDTDDYKEYLKCLYDEML